MGFQRFESNRAATKGGAVKGETVGADGVPVSRLPWVKVYPNGKSAVILIFGTAAVRKYDLKPGDPIALFWNERTQQVGMRRDRRVKNCPRLSTHGSTEKVLKLPITEFAREHFGNLPIPYRAELTDEKGLMVYDLPSKRQRAGADAERTVENPAGSSPDTPEVPKRRRGRPRKVQTEELVAV